MASGPVPSSAVETESRLRAIEALVRDEVGTVHDGRLSEQSLNAQYGSAERFAQYDIRDYGAAVDGVVITDAVMTSGSPVLSSTSYEFTSTDIGKIVGVLGAGTVSGDYVTNANDGVLVSSVLSVSGGDATLTNNAVNTVSGATAVFDN